MNIKLLSRGLFAFAVLTTLFSCNDNKNKEENAVVDKKIEEPVIVDTYEFGIRTNDFFVIKNKVAKNQTFGEILLAQNIGYPTINKLVKKSKGVFDIRRMQRNKDYTLLCKNDSLHTAEVMVYQPNKIDYVVFDMRDSMKVYTGKKKIELREREVSGIIKSSLSMALEDEGIDYRVSNSLSEIYAWTIDFFILQ